MIPVELMLRRVDNYGADSDSSLFIELMYAGEFILKIVTSAFVAAIEDDRQSHRYRLLYSLVRADGIGEWARALEETLTGPASQHLIPGFSECRREFTQRVDADAWQHQAVSMLQQVLRLADLPTQPAGGKLALRTWFQTFVELRNKTRGHGATTPALATKMAPILFNSINLIVENCSLFSLPWAFLHRNLSGRYRVVALSSDGKPFDPLKTSAAARGEHYPDGVYMYVDGLRRVEMISSDLDCADFYFPNGAFKPSGYELHSLITDSRLKGEADHYMAPAGDRPPSETEGKRELEIRNKVYTNMPGMLSDYVSRPKLEEGLLSALSNDRYPIVTLVGRGGIGKTSLALKALDELSRTDRFNAVVWFSARDIDLGTSGVKLVKPRVLTDKDIADEYKLLVSDLTTSDEAALNSVTLMGSHLHSSPFGATLFVFDNFETMRSPVDVYHWIDSHIRLPNKIAITSRFREFKADYPIEVYGMEFAEAESLVLQTARSLGIESNLSSERIDSVIHDTDGHPYMIKIVLGEMAKTGSYTKPSSLIAAKDDILEALFERTFANLSPIAARVFLLLSGWRSLIPQVAVEAVLFKQSSGEASTENGIDELVRMSLVERSRAPDGAEFLEVPLTASIFGRRKLETSPLRTVIEVDLKILQDIGATSANSFREGLRPRVEAFFRKTARRAASGGAHLDEVRPILEYLARVYAPAWLMLSELELELAGASGVPNAAEYTRRFLEAQPPKEQAVAAWQKLVELYKQLGNALATVSAFIKSTEAIDPPLNQVSAIAQLLNNASAEWEVIDPSDRKALFMPLARLLEGHLKEASATDLSRLAWLHLHAGNVRRAVEVTDLGVEKDPTNVFCRRLSERLAGEGYS